MESDFEPYLSWLGIAPDQQPPDYYSLLGVTRFEADRQVISQASAKRISHVSQFKNGERHREAQKLASELSKATSCLLNPYRKRLYDQHLKSSGTADRSSASAWPPEQGQAATKDASEVPRLAESSDPSLAAKHHASRSAGTWLIGGSVATCLAVVAIVGLSAVALRPSPSTSGQPSKAASVVEDQRETLESVAALDAEIPNEPGLPGTATTAEEPAGPPPNKDPAVTLPSTPAEPNAVATAPIPSTDSGREGTVAKEEPIRFVSSGQNALRFDGADSLELADSRGLIDPALPFTVELWVRLHSGSDSHWLIGDFVYGSSHPDLPSGTTAGWQLWITPGEPGKQRLAAATGNGFLTEFAAVENVWRHFALCRDEGQFTLFVDGRRAGSRDAELLLSTYSASPLALHVGSHGHMNPSQPAGLEGDLRAVRISSVCRYAGTFTPPQTFSSDDKTEVLLDFSAKSAHQIADVSGNDRHGTIAGADWFTDESRLVASAGRVETAPAARPDLPRAAPASPADSAPVVVKRRPIPDERQQTLARERLLEVLRDDLDSAKQPKDHMEVAAKLLTLARDTKDDPASEFVLLEEARNQAVLGGDWSQALSAIAEAETRFDVDVWQLKAAVIEQSFELIRAADERKELARRSLEVLVDLLREGRFDLANDVAQIAVTSASRARDADLGKTARRMRDQVSHAKRRWSEAEQAREQLVTEPDHPGSNLVYGRFLCFQKNDWGEGLRFLIKGSNESLQLAARLDLAASETAIEQVAAADAWHKAADSVERSDRAAVLDRVLYWARRAEPQLTGLSKVHVEKKIAEIEAELPQFVQASPGATRAGGDSASPAIPFSPPPQFRGMLGRIQVEGRDVGVLWKYECGLRLGDTSVTDVLGQVGAVAGRRHMEFVGLLYLPRSATVNVVHQGGTPTGGQLAVAIDGRKIGEVGGARPTSDVYKVELQAGEHSVRWVLTGRDFGASSLRFTDAETSGKLQVYHNQTLFTAVRETPFRARVNVNMLKN